MRHPTTQYISVKRRLLVALSLLLCSATFMIWARSHWLFDDLGWNWQKPGTNYFAAESAGGRLMLLQVWTGSQMKFADYGELIFASRDRKMAADEAYLDPDDSWRICGIKGQGQRKLGSIPSLRSNIYARELVIPWAWIILVQSAMSVWLSRDYWHGSNHDGTRCATCGYDLRATLDRCPECGSIPAS